MTSCLHSQSLPPLPHCHSLSHFVLVCSGTHYVTQVGFELAAIPMPWPLSTEEPPSLDRKSDPSTGHLPMWVVCLFFHYHSSPLLKCLTGCDQLTCFCYGFGGLTSTAPHYGSAVTVYPAAAMHLGSHQHSFLLQKSCNYLTCCCYVFGVQNSTPLQKCCDHLTCSYHAFGVLPAQCSTAEAL